MIHHIVCFRFKPGTAPAQIAEAGAGLLGMAGRIPGIRAIRFAPNLAPSATEYSHVLTVALDDMAAVQRYGDHPAHLETVARFLAPIREARLALDIEA
ncbi:MAG: Dabb family protein [Gemmatimonadota bacterium]|nr:Dabb family protein [Gemmatimonadota bacterium]